MQLKRQRVANGGIVTWIVDDKGYAILAFYDNKEAMRYIDAGCPDEFYQIWDADDGYRIMLGNRKTAHSTDGYTYKSVAEAKLLGAIHYGQPIFRVVSLPLPSFDTNPLF